MLMGSEFSLAEVPAWKLAEADEEGRSPLHWAADRGQTVCVQMLLEARAPADARDAEGATPLAYAVTCEYDEVVSLLLQFNADPEATYLHRPLS